MFMCVKLSSLFDREIKLYYVPHMLKQCLASKQCVRTTYSSLTRTCIYSRHIYSSYLIRYNSIPNKCDEHVFFLIQGCPLRLHKGREGLIDSYYINKHYSKIS